MTLQQKTTLLKKIDKILIYRQRIKKQSGEFSLNRVCQSEDIDSTEKKNDEFDKKECRFDSSSSSFVK